jgi:hypothetical protein
VILGDNANAKYIPAIFDGHRERRLHSAGKPGDWSITKVGGDVAIFRLIKEGQSIRGSKLYT